MQCDQWSAVHQAEHLGLEQSSKERLTTAWRHGQVEESHSTQPDVQAAQEWHQEAEEVQILLKERGETSSYLYI